MPVKVAEQMKSIGSQTIWQSEGFHCKRPGGLQRKPSPHQASPRRKVSPTSSGAGMMDGRNVFQDGMTQLLEVEPNGEVYSER
jgi:hypothetical protein